MFLWSLWAFSSFLFVLVVWVDGVESCQADKGVHVFWVDDHLMDIVVDADAEGPLDAVIHLLAENPLAHLGELDIHQELPISVGPEDLDLSVLGHEALHVSESTEIMVQSLATSADEGAHGLQHSLPSDLGVVILEEGILHGGDDGLECFHLFSQRLDFQLVPLSLECWSQALSWFHLEINDESL